MSDFNVRADSVDVEQIMRQIRARIREKRGADYTEAEIQQLAKVKLEKFLDPKGVRSDLIEQFRRREYTPSAPLPRLELNEFSIYGTHRGMLRWIRQLLQPILKLFINPNPLVHFVSTQARAQDEINQQIDAWMRRREQIDAKMDPLYYELLHNLVIELTRTGIEVHNLKMRVESLSSRLDFDERRGRSLERVVEYRQGAGQRPSAPSAPSASSASSAPSVSSAPSAPSVSSAPSAQTGPAPSGGDGTSDRRRRRRRRRRRPGHTMADQGGSQGPPLGGHAGNGGNGSPADNGASTDSGGPEEFDDEASDQ